VGFLIDFLTVKVVIGIIESAAVGEERFGPQDGVVHDALHAVAIAGIARHAEQVTGELEVRVGAAGSFEAAVGISQAGGDIIAVWRTQSFVRSPTTGGKALREKHFKTIFRGAQMSLASSGEIGLHGRAKRVDMAVGMASCEIVAAFGERRVISFVEILNAELFVALARAALVRQKKIFGNGVGLVPGISFVGSRAPAYPMFDGSLRQVRQRHVCGVFEDGEGVGVAHKLVRIDEPADEFVVAISGETVVRIKIAGDGFGVKLIEAKHFFADGVVGADGVGAR
jgi:hypothetical protein